jgi:predicted RecB family nuclease
MIITAHIFEAFLNCPTKSWLMFHGETGNNSFYSEWMQDRNQRYRVNGINYISEGLEPKELQATSDAGLNLKTAEWKLKANVTVHCKDLKTNIHALERIPSTGRGKPAQFVPIRFVANNKLSKIDKLLIAYDAYVFFESFKRNISQGKIIHGKNFSVTKLKLSDSSAEIAKLIILISRINSTETPPDLILNHHCPECIYKYRCLSKAQEKDDLSLLSGMTEKERKKLNSKGIFTVTQLSYTFRPRRRPKKFRDKKEKYHHSLKALAIRENKIHVVGSPELIIEGTPVYLDVEGLPDSNFYYLIGLRIFRDNSIHQYSLWADTLEDERNIWQDFINILETVDNPVLIHYGSYETEFLAKMSKCYGPYIQKTTENTKISMCINLISQLFEQVYFPTYTNSLKEIAAWLGFSWTEESAIGVNSIAYRNQWEQNKDPLLKDLLIVYNLEDCKAAEIVAQALISLHTPDELVAAPEKTNKAVYVKSLKRPQRRWGKFISPFKELEEINQTASWDYQRDRIYVKSKINVKTKSIRKNGARKKWWRNLPINKVVVSPERSTCPLCGEICDSVKHHTRMLYDLFFGRASIKGRVIRYYFNEYLCNKCQKLFGEPHEFCPGSQFGRNLVAYILYEAIDLKTPFVTVQKNLSRFFKLDLQEYTLRFIRKAAAIRYKNTYDKILEHLVTGALLHVDETEVSIRGKPAYVWVFTNLYDVVYLYASGRDGAFLHDLLKDFKGILLSDFYGAYDSLKCPQQKCLVHLMRDLNDEVLAHPYDEELKTIVKDFASLLKPIVETIDRKGLKRRFLVKHLVDVRRFFHKLANLNCKSEIAAKIKQRFDKNREKLFTFLNYDGIPWNNNNAEHAVKEFAHIRDIVRGSFTEDSVRGYLVMLSLSQTCKCYKLDFFDFLRSGEEDIYAYSMHSRRHRIV